MAKKMGFFSLVAERLSGRFPGLKQTLLLANMKEAPQAFLTKVIGSAFMFSITLLVLTAFLFIQARFIDFNNLEVLNVLLLIPLFIFYLVFFFFYFRLYPRVMMLKRKRELDYEVVFAGRHLVIALKSGVPLFDAMVGVSGGYGAASNEFSKVVQKVTVGTPMGQAIREITQICPSGYFVRVLMQISNSLSSGADVGDALDSVLDQITKEQLIQLKEYGQKLTPTVMFFMVFGIILPSIGVVLITVLFSVVSGGRAGLPSNLLLYVFVFIAIVQFLFLGIIESSRPKYLV